MTAFLRRAFQPQAWQVPLQVGAFEDAGFQPSAFTVTPVAFQDAFEGQAFQLNQPVLRVLGGVGGITTGEAFGQTSKVRLIVQSVGLVSAESFGNGAAQRRAAPTGISSAEVLGSNVKLIRRALLIAIGGGEAIGGLTTIGGVQVLDTPSALATVLLSDQRTIGELRVGDQVAFDVLLSSLANGGEPLLSDLLVGDTSLSDERLLELAVSDRVIQ